jgi:tryptophan-rich sensory protein
MHKRYSLLGFLALVFAISALSSWVTMPAVAGWYQTLHKAPWNPPDWVFGPVWTLLYLMIALAGWHVWNRLSAATFTGRLRHPVMRPYWLQLMCNFLWSMLFFGMAQPLLAAIDIGLMIIAIALNMRTFYGMDKMGAYLLAPYLLWVLYASTLNIAIVALN